MLEPRVRTVALALLLGMTPGLALAQPGEEPQEAVEGEDEESLVTYSAEIDFVSRYVWRGLAVTEGAAMQPAVSVDAFGASLWAWTNLVLQHEPDEGRFNEIDAGLRYAYGWEWLEVSAGLETWVYPYAQDSTTGQADVELAASVGPFSFFTRQTVDIATFAGAWYGELGVRFAYETDEGPAIDGSLLTSWASDDFNDTYLGVAETAWNLLEAGFSVTFPFPYVYVRAHAGCSVLLDSELRAAVDEPFLVVGGVALGTEGPP